MDISFFQIYAAMAMATGVMCARFVKRMWADAIAGDDGQEPDYSKSRPRARFIMETFYTSFRTERKKHGVVGKDDIIPFGKFCFMIWVITTVCFPAVVLLFIHSNWPWQPEKLTPTDDECDE